MNLEIFLPMTEAQKCANGDIRKLNEVLFCFKIIKKN